MFYQICIRDTDGRDARHHVVGFHVVAYDLG
jgi:hypothetical protein